MQASLELAGDVRVVGLLAPACQALITGLGELIGFLQEHVDELVTAFVLAGVEVRLCLVALGDQAFTRGLG